MFVYNYWFTDWYVYFLKIPLVAEQHAMATGPWGRQEKGLLISRSVRMIVPVLVQTCNQSRKRNTAHEAKLYQTP